MKRKIIPYNPRLKEFARKLRNNSTESEIKLWLHLKNSGMMGYDFDRQKPIGNYICDFFCVDLMLAIETDGISHEIEEVYKRDLEKDAFLKTVGIEVLRFIDDDVLNNIENVLRVIETKINTLNLHS